MTGVKAGAVDAVKTELWIVINAAHQMACGYGLSSADVDRLDRAHDFLLRVLDEVQA